MRELLQCLYYYQQMWGILDEWYIKDNYMLIDTDMKYGRCIRVYPHYNPKAKEPNCYYSYYRQKIYDIFWKILKM